MRDWLHRLLLALMPWYDPEAAARETRDALRAIERSEERRRLLASYREYDRRVGRMSGR